MRSLARPRQDVVPEPDGHRRLGGDRAQQNIQVAAGQIGQPPVPNGQVFQYTMTTLGRLEDTEQFANIILKTDTDGRIVRLRDVARIELGAQGYDQTCTLDGQPSVALSIYQRPGSNALNTADLVKNKMEELKQRFPEGIDYSIVYDTTPFITESVQRGLQDLARRGHPRRRGGAAVPPELAVGPDPV